ncbi:MAG TPA: hypothetical protein DEF45_17980 [Rhodopirellula sp.]|nr:hypothetical protein [Rhodopirellula sp.]
MLAFLKHLRKRWEDWCGDHEMETTIRKHLTQNGFFGGTARLRNVRLVAVERPGWLQVFRFDATVRVKPETEDDDGVAPEAEYREVFGLVKDDIRHKVNTVRFFEEEEQRVELFARWSDGLICLRGAHGLANHELSAK